MVFLWDLKGLLKGMVRGRFGMVMDCKARLDEEDMGCFGILGKTWHKSKFSKSIFGN